jgi:hypothetical protein
MYPKALVGILLGPTSENNTDTNSANIFKFLRFATLDKILSDPLYKGTMCMGDMDMDVGIIWTWI